MLLIGSFGSSFQLGDSQMVTLFFWVILQTGSAYTITPFPTVAACEQGAKQMQAIYLTVPGFRGHGFACVAPVIITLPTEPERKS